MLAKKFYRKMSVALLIVISIGALSACAPIILGGAALGVSMTADRRTAGAQLDDQRIELRATKIIRNTLALSVAHINVTSYNRWVLLTGEVPSEADKQLAQRVIASIENVQRVMNELTVGSNASWSQISSDTLITARVKAAIMNTKNVYATSFDFTTEQGVVYMMGRVTENEARTATNVISSLSGVRKVVRALDVVSSTELARMITAQPDGGSSRSQITKPPPPPSR